MAPAQLGDAAGMQRVLARMDASGVVAEGMTYLALAKSCEDGGLPQAEHFLDRAEKLGVNLAQHLGIDQPKNKWEGSGQKARRRKSNWPDSDDS